MPFGLDLKSIILGVLLAWFVLPYVQAQFVKVTSSNSGR